MSGEFKTVAIHNENSFAGVTLAILHLAETIEERFPTEAEKEWAERQVRAAHTAAVTARQPDPEYPEPSLPTRSCWRSLKVHRWGSKYGWFNGAHWFKVCRDCHKMKLSAHVDCDVSCWGGPL